MSGSELQQARARQQRQERSRPDLRSLLNRIKGPQRTEQQLADLADEEERDILLRLEVTLRSTNPAQVRAVVSDVLQCFSYRRGTIDKRLDLVGDEMSLRMEYSGSVPLHSTTDDREGFLESKEMLLAQYAGMYVAFIGGEMVEVDASFERLVSRIRDRRPSVDVYVACVDEATFEEDDRVMEMPGLYESDSIMGDDNELAAIFPGETH